MKKRTGKAKAKASPEAGVDIPRTDALLAQLLLHSLGGGGQQKKACALHAAGFSNVEVAKLMDTTAAVVAQVLYQARQGRARKTTKRKRIRSRKS